MNIASDSRILMIGDLPSIGDEFRQLDRGSTGQQGLGLMRVALMEGRPYALAFVDMDLRAGWGSSHTIEELWRADGQLQVVLCFETADSSLEQAVTRLGSPDLLATLRKPFAPIEARQLAHALLSRRRLAQEAASHLANLEQVLRDIREAGVETRRRNRELGELAESIWRDLNSPLTAIGLFGASLSPDFRGPRSNKVANYLTELRLGANGGDQLFASVPALAEITCAAMAPETLDLSQMARDAMARQRDAHPGRTVSTGVQDGLRAWGDARMVRSMLEHLLDNAWKFTGRQQIAAITVGANLDADGQFVFFVRDSGCGFDAACAGHLFRKFQRLHRASEFAGGGVGLVAVGRIVERHGGRAWADSRPGQGTTVYFTLPNPASAGAQASRAAMIRIIAPAPAAPARARVQSGRPAAKTPAPSPL
jgi:two-component system NtrC family sensor kinase